MRAGDVSVQRVHPLDDIVRISVGFHGPNGIEHAFGCLLGGSHWTRSLWNPSDRRSLRGDPGPGRLPYGEWLPRSFVQPDRTIVGHRHDVLHPHPEPAR